MENEEVTQRKINLKNIFIIVVIIILLIGGGVGIWLLLSRPSPEPPSQTSTSTSSAEKDETADWKPAKNDIFNYTIKYPPGWGALMCGNGITLIADSEFDSESKKYRTEDSKVLAGALYCGSSARTRIIIFRGQVFTDEKSVWSKFGSAKHTNYQEEIIVINSNSGIKTSYTSKKSSGISEGVKYIEYFLDITNNEALIVNYVRSPADAYNPQQLDYSEILEQMVSTLKFID